MAHPSALSNWNRIVPVPVSTTETPVPDGAVTDAPGTAACAFCAEALSR